jgi:hypothetical protein
MTLDDASLPSASSRAANRTDASIQSRDVPSRISSFRILGRVAIRGYRLPRWRESRTQYASPRRKSHVHRGGIAYAEGASRARARGGARRIISLASVERGGKRLVNPRAFQGRLWCRSKRHQHPVRRPPRAEAGLCFPRNSGRRAGSRSNGASSRPGCG